MERKKRKSAKKKKNPVDDSEELLACAVCGLIMFENKASLLCHLRYHFHREREHLECQICRRIFFSKNSLSSHVKVHSFDRNLPCGVCGKMFKWPGSLKSHIENHSREKPFYCHVCDKAFRFQHGIENHMRNHEIKLQKHEEAEEMNSGEIIPVVFKSGNNGLKAVKPPDDPSSIVSNLLMKADMPSLPLPDLPPLPSLSAIPPLPQVSLNIASKPVKCASCSRTFYDMVNLNEHMKKYHGAPDSLIRGVVKSSMGGATDSSTGVKTKKSTTGSASMKCPTCLESFPDFKTLKVHINSHNEVYKCSLCNSFINGGDLRDHIKYHSKHKGSKVLLFNKL